MMDLSSRLFNPHSLLLIISVVILLVPSRVEDVAVAAAAALSLGINYGRIGNNLPSPDKAVLLLKSIGASRVKIYDADPQVLKAFANTNIELSIGLGNEYLPKMASDPSEAAAWVKTNVQCHLPATKIISIAVGNEALTFNNATTSYLLPTMHNLHSALSALHLDDTVTVTTSHSLAILDTSYPPSSAKFKPELVDCVRKIVAFNAKTGSPFLIKAYPFLAYKTNPKQVSLDFVLFQANAENNNGVIIDPVTKLRYDNMLFAQIDAVHTALEKIGCKDTCVQISETGWPSKGDADEIGASPENANKYNENLMKLMQQRKGTPMRPNANLNIYVFALFNENLKPGPTSERNFGLFKPDGTPAYPLGLGGGASLSSTNNSTTTSGGGGGGGGSSSSSSSSSGGSSTTTSSPPGESSNGYMSITSDTGRSHLKHSALWMVICLIASITEVVMVMIIQR